MKKREILSLINAKKVIQKNKELLFIVKSQYDFTLDEKNWFPNIPELSNEFDILRKELKETLSESEQMKEEYNRLTCNCKHEVRLEGLGSFGTRYYECVFCGKHIRCGNDEIWEESINLNRHCVNLLHKYSCDEDGYEYVLKEDAYTYDDVIDVIENILQDKDLEEEIDLVNEFKKLNLKHCSINDKKLKSEYYILIIGGSNRQYIEDDFYLSKINRLDSIGFLKYFKDMLNMKVALIDNSQIISGNECIKIQEEKNPNLKFCKYDTIKEVLSSLKEVANIPFNLIINLSEIYTYGVVNNEIIKEKYELDLKGVFPNSYIININDISDVNFDSISEFLKNYTNIGNQYVYHNHNYYYLEKGEIAKNNIDGVCNIMRKVFKK